MNGGGTNYRTFNPVEVEQIKEIKSHKFVVIILNFYF